jgi:hypothetical protein
VYCAICDDQQTLGTFSNQSFILKQPIVIIIYVYICTSAKTWEVYRPAEVNQEHWVLLSFRSTLLIDNGLFTLFSFDSC